MINIFVPTQTQAFTSLVKAQRHEMSLFEETKSFKSTLISTINPSKLYFFKLNYVNNWFGNRNKMDKLV